MNGRIGWNRMPLTISTIKGPVEIDAHHYGTLAVHRMYGDEGWCISYAPKGLRMSSDGRVFVTCEAAMAMVEQLYPLTNDWASFFDNPTPDHLRHAFNDAHDKADERGDFLSTITVRPARIRA
jgi:hypothetical protein